MNNYDIIFYKLDPLIKYNNYIHEYIATILNSTTRTYNINDCRINKRSLVRLDYSC